MEVGIPGPAPGRWPEKTVLIVFMLLFAIILTPSIGRGTGLPALRLEQLLLFMALLYVYARICFRKETILHFSLFPLLLMGFSFFIGLSFLGSYFQGIRVTPSDLFEIYKPFVYSGIFVIAATVAVTEKDSLKVLICTNMLIAFSAVIAVTQFLNPFNINEKYIPLIAPTQYRTLVGGYRNPRVVGITGNPNVYAVIAALGVMISLALFLKTKKKHNLLLAFLCLIALFMTSSRTGFAFLIVTIGTFYFQHFRDIIFRQGIISVKGLKVSLIIILQLAIIFYVIVNFFPTNLTWRIIDGFTFTSTSWQARINHWSENLNLFRLSPLIGVGPAKSIDFRHAADNEWLLLLRRYGIAGTLYLIFAFVFPVFYYGKQLKTKLAFKIYTSTLAGLAVYMIPAAAFHSFQLMPLVMILAALAFTDVHRLKKVG